jgi:hypothetical protein
MPKAKPTKIDCDDLLSRTGAGLLAEVINAYWRERGYSAGAERYELDGCKSAWGVRSSLVNGLPAKSKGRTVAERRAEFLG